MEKEKSHFSLTWDKYHSSMCTGFSLLQQNGELVDLTLAADGHLVKVHQIILGIASPYLKELIQSADSKNPVIFMNNVSYSVLRSILEYIYTGEVSVSEDNLDDFLETAKNLQIKGLVDTPSLSQLNDEFATTTIVQTISAPSLESTDDKDSKDSTMPFPVNVKNIQVKRKSPSFFQMIDSKPKVARSSSIPEEAAKDDSNGSALEDMAHDDGGEGEDNASEKFDLTGLVESPSVSKPIAEVQYTVSNRGALQLILNRYMYNFISKTIGGLRTWKCVEYRANRCLASVVTDKNVVIKRTNLHNHPFDDKRILKKIKKKAVFSAIKTEEDRLKRTEFQFE